MFDYLHAHSDEEQREEGGKVQTSHLPGSWTGADIMISDTGFCQDHWISPSNGCNIVWTSEKDGRCNVRIADQFSTGEMTEKTERGMNREVRRKQGGKLHVRFVICSREGANGGADGPWCVPTTDSSCDS